MDWLDEILNDNATTAPTQTMTPDEPKAGKIPSPARRRVGLPIHPNNWGSGGKATLLPGEEAPASESASSASTPASSTSSSTPAEDVELRKRKEAKREIVIPEKPSVPPTVHEEPKSDEALKEAPKETEAVAGEAEGDEETKGRIRAALTKTRAVTGAAKEKVSKKAGPVREKISNEIDPKKAQKWSLLWAGGASWVIAPGTFGALYDRAVLMFGSWTEAFPRAEYLNSGGLPHEWDLLQGPAWWVNETVGAAWESGATNELLIAALVGLVPTVSLLTFHHRIVRFFTVIGVAYFIGFEWFPHWWEVYMATMTACAYYGWTMANRIESAFLACMLRVPVAAIVSGTILYSPGAIF